MGEFLLGHDPAQPPRHVPVHQRYLGIGRGHGAPCRGARGGAGHARLDALRPRGQLASIGHNKAVEVENNHDEVIGGNMTLSVGPSHIAKIMNKSLATMAQGIAAIGHKLGVPGMINPGEGNLSIFVEKNQLHTVGVSSAETVGIHKNTVAGVSYKLEVGKEMTVKVGDELAIGVGKSRLILQKDGTIVLVGSTIKIEGSDKVEINGEIVKVN
jgi:type VI secretion system secreted protein VgrG